MIRNELLIAKNRVANFEGIIRFELWKKFAELRELSWETFSGAELSWELILKS